MTTSHTLATHTDYLLDQARAGMERVIRQLDAMDARADRAAHLQPGKPSAADARLIRSLELAQGAGLGAWSCRFVSLDLRPDSLPSRVVVRVPSSRVPFVSYRVEIDLPSATASCECPAGQFGRACKHQGVGWLYAREAVRAFRSAAADLEAQLRAEERERALRPSL